jgi:WD40 repeat protein
VAAARELAAAADANLDVDPERSMLLAIAAIEETRSVDGSVLREAEEALHRAVGATRIELRVPDVGGALDWSPDGTVSVTEGPEESGMIDVRDAATGASLRSWRGHDIDVNDVAFSADGTRLATTGDDGALRVWDPSTGELISESRGDEPTSVWGPSFSPDGELVAATWLGHDVVRTVEVATGRTAREIPVVAPFLTSFSPDGARLVVSGEPVGSATVVDIRSGDTVMTQDGHEGGVRDVAWSPDGRWIATTTFDVANVRIFDAATGELRFTLFGHATEVRHAAWSADGSRLATASGDGTVRIWIVTDGGAEEALVLAAQDPSDGAVGVAFSPDGTQVMAGDQTVEVVLVWNVEDLGAGEWAKVATNPDAWTPLASAPDGYHVLTAGPRHAVTMWDPRDRRRGARVRRRPAGSAVRRRRGPDGGRRVRRRHGRGMGRRHGDAAVRRQRRPGPGGDRRQRRRRPRGDQPVRGAGSHPRRRRRDTAGR